MKSFVLLSVTLLFSPLNVQAAPSTLYLRQRLPKIGSGPATATDGSTILEDQVTVNGLPVRFKVSAPANQFTGNANAKGNTRNGALGINVLFHGDGGQSFFDFPNQGVNNGLMGVALLAPNSQLRWGGFDPQDQTGLVRPDGAAHSAAVNTFLTTMLPKVVNFDQSKIFMEGVSGGSLLLSGFMIPTFGASLGVPGVVFGCGGLPPQVNVQGDISNIRIHWQSTIHDLPDLKTSIPQCITAYEKIASDAGLSNAQIDQLLTADASPNGGHCEFDEKDFVSGVQLLTDNYGAVINGQATLNGVTVTNGVVGNEDLFGTSTSAQVATTAAAKGTGTGNARAKSSRVGKNGN
ncbi:hypothetical protein AN958_00369 [Leucoagaricus sp. SymC.cos]|nr:hypothetical protein AN958_00369 [Leucoagaricus sp. SymC.cos]